MADTYVDLAICELACIAGDALYASIYLATGEHVRQEAICPWPRDQSVRDLYRYRSGARRVHRFRSQLEIYFGAPPLFFVRADDDGIEPGTDHIRTLVDRYHQLWRNEPAPRRKCDRLPRKKVSKAELQAMVCHEGKWYVDQDELEEATEEKEYEAELLPWAIPSWMLKPKPRKGLVRRPAKRWIV